MTFTNMTPPPEAEVESAERASRSRAGGRITLAVAAVGLALGYIGGSLRNSFNPADFFGQDLQSGRDRTLRNNDSIKLYGAEISLKDWVLRIDAEGTTRYLEEFPDRNIEFRILNEEGEINTVVTANPGDYKDIPQVFRSDARQLSGIAKSLGLRGLEEPRIGHSGVLSHEIRFQPTYGDRPVLLIEEQAWGGGEHPEVRSRVIVDLQLETYRYGNRGSDSGLKVSAARPLTEAELKNLNQWGEEVNKYAKELFDVQVAGTQEIQYNTRTGGFIIDPRHLSSLRTLRENTPFAVQTLLLSRFTIKSDGIEGAQTLLEIEKFLKRPYMKLASGGDWWGAFQVSTPVNNLLDLETYKPKAKDTAGAGRYVDSLEALLAGIETAAILYPEEFKKRFNALSSSEKKAVRGFINGPMRSVRSQYSDPTEYAAQLVGDQKN